VIDGAKFLARPIIPEVRRLRSAHDLGWKLQVERRTGRIAAARTKPNARVTIGLPIGEPTRILAWIGKISLPAASLIVVVMAHRRIIAYTRPRRLPAASHRRANAC